MIGRKKELQALEDCKIADRSRFVVVYGRRRVGKTFLVREAKLSLTKREAEHILSELKAKAAQLPLAGKYRSSAVCGQGRIV